jgi:hypothetical protein
VYGPTECTVDATACAVGGEAPTIGRPLANVEAWVLGPALELLPVGAIGELCLGGPGVGRGYVGRPALTAERFVPSPFGDGARLYRTGDRARFRADGTLEFLGRADQQVKIRGYRIELGEIEAALGAHADVRGCAVVVRHDGGEARLCAYVVGDADAAALREHLRARLPEYMVPAAFVALAALPLTANGKLDARALPAPDLAAGAGPYQAPRTETEAELAAIVGAVLHLPRVSVDADFFAIGGHSLLATQVMSRIRARFGVDVPVRALFESPTVAGIARAIDALVAAAHGDDAEEGAL